MPDDLATVRSRIHGVQQLDTVISAMRGIAAAHAQQSRLLLPGFRAYAEVIARAIAAALRLRDDEPRARFARGRCARIVFCAEQGFVGGFVERVLDDAVTRGPADLFLVGSRALPLATARKLAVVWRSPMVTQPDGVSALCMRIAGALYDMMLQQQITTVEVVYPLWTPAEDLRVIGRSLLPLDERRFTATARMMPPLITLPPDALLASLAEEYLFASLCEAAMHAFVAENEARAATMVRARGKIHDMLAALHLSEHRVRQESITAELVELASGSLAEPLSMLGK